jgi:hypothetical protein
VFIRWQRRVYQPVLYILRPPRRKAEPGTLAALVQERVARVSVPPPTISYRALLVESARINGKVRQRRIASLGQVSAETWQDERERHAYLLWALDKAERAGRITALQRLAAYPLPTEAEAADLEWARAYIAGIKPD